MTAGQVHALQIQSQCMIQQTWLDNEDLRVSLVPRDYQMWSETHEHNLADREDNFALSEVSTILRGTSVAGAVVVQIKVRAMLFVLAFSYVSQRTLGQAWRRG